MESMSRAPYLLTKAREGYRLGHGELLDAMILDGLWDVYGQKHMGTCGDSAPTSISSAAAEQDDFAVRSHTRASARSPQGVFDAEIVPVEVSSRGKTTRVSVDEGPAKFDEAKLRALKPAFGSGRDDHGRQRLEHQRRCRCAAGGSPEQCRAAKLKPIAEIVGAATFSQQPEWFTTAPVAAIRLLLDKVGWTVDQVDLFEINEAFAVVTMVAERELGIPPEKVNIHGGAVALGHPIGCSGARILVTLLNALKRTGGRRGIASLCIGGGEAVALAVETLD